MTSNNEIQIETDAEWLLLARKKLSMTQAELGKNTNYSYVTISKIEKGVIDLSDKLEARVRLLLKERNIIE